MKPRSTEIFTYFARHRCRCRRLLCLGVQAFLVPLPAHFSPLSLSLSFSEQEGVALKFASYEAHSATSIFAAKRTECSFSTCPTPISRGIIPHENEGWVVGITTTCSGWLRLASPALWPGPFSSPLTVGFDARRVHYVLEARPRLKNKTTSAARTTCLRRAITLAYKQSWSLDTLHDREFRKGC